MALKKGQISKKLYTFIKSQNNKKVEDPDKAIKEYCDQIEADVFTAIKSQTLNITITIPIGAINVVGSSGPSSNPSPIVIKTQAVVIS